MSMFHVIEPTVWKRALFVLALLGVASVMYWVSSTQKEGMVATSVSLFDKWLASSTAEPEDAQIHDVNTQLSLIDGTFESSAPRIRVEPINSGFFDEYRIERDRSRSLQVEQLREFLDSTNPLDTEAKNELLQLLQRTEQELQAEGILRARGLSEALVVLADAGAIVVVTDSISQAEAGSIGSIIASVTGIPMEHITISDGVIAR